MGMEGPEALGDSGGIMEDPEDPEDLGDTMGALEGREGRAITAALGKGLGSEEGIGGRGHWGKEHLA